MMIYKKTPVKTGHDRGQSVQNCEDVLKLILSISLYKSPEARRKTGPRPFVSEKKDGLFLHLRILCLIICQK